MLRYDGLSRQIRMADVIEMTHPSPRDDRQSALFKFLLDRRPVEADPLYSDYVDIIRVFSCHFVDRSCRWESGDDPRNHTKRHETQSPEIGGSASAAG